MILGVGQFNSVIL